MLYFRFVPYLRRMEKYDEKVALCALNKVFGYHPRLGRELMEKAGSALALFAGPGASAPDSRSPAPPGPAALGAAAPHPELLAQLTPALLAWAARELDQVRTRGFRFIGLGEEDYPAPLLECEDPPLGLYLNGSSSPAQIFGFRPLVGVVGTRDISPYGRAWCRKLVQALADATVQPAIVSGMAYGADFIAHETALQCGLPTIGVLPTGIETIYPRQHEPLAVRMVGTPGCALVTDYPMGTSPVALNFLRRNRIIAGLVRGVIVVESKTKGGSLMTARYATEYNRDVFALPGRADDLRSAGCNSLIASHMAEIISTPEALVDALGLGRPSRRHAPGQNDRQAPGQPLRTTADPPLRVTSEQPPRVTSEPALRVPSGQPLRVNAPAPDACGPAQLVTEDVGPRTARDTPPAQPLTREEALSTVLGRQFGPESPVRAVGMAIQAHRGALPDELAALTRLPIGTVLESIGLLEAAGLASTDLLRRCSIAPEYD